MQTLAPTNLTSIGEIMGVRKSIPQYQRDFVWEDSLVRSFLDNIYDEFEKGTPSYFTGSMVLYESSNSDVYEIVDGQQRITVLYTLISEILNKLKEFAPESNFPSVQKSFYISAPTDMEKEKYLFVHNRRNIKKYLEMIGDGRTDPYDDNDDDVLLKSLKSCKSKVQEFVKEKELKQKQLKDFYDYVLKNVKVIYYLAGDINEALLIYSRLNSGGKILGHLEIIKGRLFHYADKETSAEWDALDVLWENFWQLFKTHIQIGGVHHFKPLISEETFISYYFFVKHRNVVNQMPNISDGFLSTNKISKFLLNNDLDKQVFGNPISFIEDLTKFTENVRDLRVGNYPSNEKIENTLKDIALLSQTQTQPLMFLLSCLNYNILNEQIVDRVFYLVFIFSMSVTGSGSTSGVWKNLGNMVNSKIKNTKQKDLITLVTEELDKQISNFWDSHFENMFDNIRIDQGRQKIKTILIVLEIAMRRYAGIKDNIYYKDFLYRRNLDVDHLRPQNDPFEGNLDREEKEKIIQSIGNAAFLTDSNNRALQDKSFDSKKKRTALETCEMFGTRAVVTEENDMNGKEKKAVARISKATEMNAGEIETRKKEILAILKEFVGAP